MKLLLICIAMLYFSGEAYSQNYTSNLTVEQKAKLSVEHKILKNQSKTIKKDTPRNKLAYSNSNEETISQNKEFRYTHVVKSSVAHLKHKELED